ncbi:hypothetical protein PTKIN_Ptkin12aG0196600 [Pterospermum kingtungense]
METKPVQTPALPDSGGGGAQKRSEKKVKIEEEVEGEKKEGSPSIKLGLGIDGKTREKSVMKHGKCVFTTAQLYELQLQALVFKYIAGGVPVPNNLVLPIWKSVASSLGSAHGGVYPSFLGVSPIGFDYRKMMDPEPGRCRRTDGKKWRCGKNVIPDQKYCEQHMHRGCRRSRKPVEHSQIALPDSTLSKNSNEVSENSNNLSAAVSFQCMKPSSCKTSNSHETTASTAIDSNNVCSNRNSVSTNATTSSTIVTATNDDRNVCKRIKSSPNTSEKGEEKLAVDDNSIINRSSKTGNRSTVGNSISPSLDFSPKSVLQALGCSNSRVYKNEIEREPGRCRRTDGKRWRCSRDVIPDQKYCARHMHRGARKPVEVPQPVATPTAGDCPPSRSTIANKPAYTTLNTSLSISIPSPHQLITQDEKSMSSGSETTISDTTITAFDNVSLLSGTGRFYSNPNSQTQRILRRAVSSVARCSKQSLCRAFLWASSRRWTPGEVATTVILGSCLCFFIIGGKIERVPYSKRFHYTLSDKWEKKLSKYHWQLFEEENRGEILLQSDPRVVRVDSIARKILQAMNKGLMLQHHYQIIGQTSQSSRMLNPINIAPNFGASEDFAVNADSTTRQDIIQLSRKLRWKPATKHLDGKVWEFYVTDSSVENAFCLPGGKIVINNGLLRSLKSDAEVATVIAHEIGHAVARHLAEGSMVLFAAFDSLLFWCIGAGRRGSYGLLFVGCGLACVVLLALLSINSRRREAEADYIGLMLMASAGYDPQVAVDVYECFNHYSSKTDMLEAIFSTHYPGTKRAELLKKPETMELAKQIFQQVKAGKGVISFV